MLGSAKAPEGVLDLAASRRLATESHGDHALALRWKRNVSHTYDIGGKMHSSANCSV